ncbi:hypothetical protein chiPu_0033790, partial [Chiloscyllium punctatum]|nr:hypothetical protein [Chiloscyllium punctatum]
MRGLHPRREPLTRLRCFRIEATLSHKGRGRKPLIHHLRDGLAARRGVGIAAEIARAQRAFAERAFDRADDGIRGLLLAEVLQH